MMAKANASHLSLLLPLLLLSTLSHSLSVSAVAAGKCHPGDESALLAFKNAMKDPSGILAAWKPNSNCCEWNGITCKDSSRVTEIELSGVDQLTPGSELVGTIPLGFSKLQMLHTLWLTNFNNLTGPFPAAILNLPNLDFLEISDTQLSGPLPADIGRRLPKLEHLALFRNKLSGRLPSSLAELSHLTQLELSENQFVGEIPPVLANLKNLTVLQLDHNSLSGTIPDFSSLKELLWLTLQYNRLSGGIPAALPPKLTFLTLGNNSFSGTIPAQIGNLAGLMTLDLSANLLRGPVPSSFSNLANLTVLDLSHNSLEDPFPAMNYATNIFSLDLSGNNFNLGMIPRWVESSTTIFNLKLRGCGLRMRMEDVKTLGTYEIVDLSDNEITGDPTGFLSKAGEVTSFRASNNMLKFDMAKLEFGSLGVLDIAHNQAYGSLPEMTRWVQELNVSYNHLCGPIPGPNNFPASAFANNDCLCGAPLRRCSRRGV